MTDTSSSPGQGIIIEVQKQELIVDTSLVAYLGGGRFGYGLEGDAGFTFPVDLDSDSLIRWEDFGGNFRFGLALRFDFTDFFAISAGAGYEKRSNYFSIKYPDYNGMLQNGHATLTERGVYCRAQVEFIFSHFMLGLGLVVSTPISREMDYEYIASFHYDDYTVYMQGICITPGLIFAYYM